jgi:hypothetical protein
MKPRPIRCDHCGLALTRLDRAAVVVRSRSGIALEISLHHSGGCVRAKLAEAGQVEIIPAIDFASSREHLARLRRLPKVMSGASLSRVLRKIERLAALQAAPAPERATEAA